MDWSEVLFIDTGFEVVIEVIVSCGNWIILMVNDSLRLSDWKFRKLELILCCVCIVVPALFYNIMYNQFI